MSAKLSCRKQRGSRVKRSAGGLAKAFASRRPIRLLIAAAGLVLAAAPAFAAETKVYSLGAAVSGGVAKILVADGAHVDAGAPILKLDCRPREQEIQARAADLASADAVYRRVKNGPRLDEIAI